MNGDFGRALTVESAKMRRAPVIVVCSVVIVLAPTLLAVAAVLALRAESGADFAEKARAVIHGSGWEAYLGAGAEVMSVAVLLSLGFGFAWCFGREFVEGTVVNLFALPVDRGRVALAKCLVLLVWSVLVSVASSLLLLLVGVLIGSMGEQSPRWWLPFGVCLLTACNTFPLAWIATVSRGYLGPLGGLLGLVVVTQIVTAVGAGAWFPWAVPGLWAGFGGPEADVRMAYFLPPVIIAIVSIGATVLTWRRLELGNA